MFEIAVALILPILFGLTAEVFASLRAWTVHVVSLNLSLILHAAINAGVVLTPTLLTVFVVWLAISIILGCLIALYFAGRFWMFAARSTQVN